MRGKKYIVPFPEGWVLTSPYVRSVCEKAGPVSINCALFSRQTAISHVCSSWLRKSINWRGSLARPSVVERFHREITIIDLPYYMFVWDSETISNASPGPQVTLDPTLRGGAVPREKISEKEKKKKKNGAAYLKKRWGNKPRQAHERRSPGHLTAFSANK